MSQDTDYYTIPITETERRFMGLKELVQKNKQLFQEAILHMRKIRKRRQDQLRFINESIDRSKLTIFPGLK